MGAWAQAYLRTKLHLDPCIRLAIIDSTPFGGGAESLNKNVAWAEAQLIQCGLIRGLPVYRVSSWSIQPFGHNTPTLQTDTQETQRSHSRGQTVLATVCKTVRSMLPDRCMSCLSVLSATLAYCGHTLGWIKLKLNAGRPRPRLHCVRWRPSSPFQKGHKPPIFSPCLLWPNSWMDKDAAWYGGRPHPGDIVLDGDHASPKKEGAQHPQFGAMYCYLCTEFPAWIKMPLSTGVGLGQSRLC